MTKKAFNKRIPDAINRARAYILSRYKVDGSDLDDILQEASLKAFKGLRNFRGKCTFETWFICICRMEVNLMFRKQKKQSLAFPIDENRTSLEEKAEEESARSVVEEQQFLITRAMQELSEKHREIIKLALEKGCSSQELSNMLKIPVSSARTRLFYAKKRLQKLVQFYAHQSNIELVGN